MKRILSIILAACLCLSSLPLALAEEATGIWPAVAGENGTTYVNLFSLILADDCYGIWYDDCAAVMGEENAATTVAALQGSISSELYGEAATEAFGTSPQGAAFDCFYINGLKAVTFSGDTAIVELEDGSTETHTYEYIGQYLVGEGEHMVYYGQEFEVAFPCDVYKSMDEAGEFNYFFLRDDTMAETYHIEFRYGSDMEALQGYFIGPYAYWLTAGFDANADEQTLRNVIDLFCLENMDYSAHTENALAQLNELGIVGSWRADLSAFGEAYAAVDLSMTIDENGHGITMMNGAQTADFEAYAFDSGEKGDGEGLYVAYSNLEHDAESAPYMLTENENGALVLTLTADDGTISWVKQDEAVSSAVIAISTVEELAAINQNLSGHYVLTADIDLGGAEWTPIGTFLPAGESAEEQEIPNASYAFTGSFDGQGHIISNFIINQPEGWCIGLFGCIANADVGNFKVENVKADGALMASAVVGYAFCSTVHDIDLSNATVTAHWTEMSAEGMYGGIVGAGMGSLISDCSASTDIIIPDGTANAGIVGGGLEGTSVVHCSATGTLTAGNNCYGLGGVSGCGFGAEQFTNCKAENVTITAGDNCFWIGGITGYAGGYEDPAYGTPVTFFTACTAENVSITTGENADGISAIVGAGFYQDGLAEIYGEMFAAPSQFTLTDCASVQVTLNGEEIK